MKGQILKYNLLNIFINATYFIPVFVLFLQSNGLSMTQVYLLQSIFSITIIALELPTGYFADVYGRKSSIIITGIFSTLGMIIYSFSSDFIFFVIAEIFWGIGFSFMSGSASAFLYDVLLVSKKEAYYSRYEGRAFFYGRFFSIFAAIIGAHVAQYSLRYPLMLMIPQLLLFIIIASSLKEPPRERIRKDYVNEFLGILKLTFMHKELRGLVIYSGLVGGFGTVAYWLIQPYMYALDFPLVSYGYMFAGFSIITAIVAFYAHDIEKFLGRRLSLTILGFMIGFPMLLMGLFPGRFMLLSMIFVEFAWAFQIPVIRDYINRIVESKKRATVLSIASLAAMFINALFAPLIGIFTDYLGVNAAMAIGGMIALLLSFQILMAFKKESLI